MKRFYNKINIYLINRPWAILATSIVYYLVLSIMFNQTAYCWGWDFPLEKDVARQSWQERPEGEFYAIIEKKKIINNGNQSCEDADYNKRIIIEPVKELSPEEIIALRENEFKESLAKLSPRKRAEKISGYLFEQLDMLLRENANRNDVSIRAILASMIKNNATTEFWFVHNQADAIQESVAANIVGCNYALINTSGKLSDGQKLLFAHINVQIAMVNIAESRNMSFEQLIQQDDLYHNFLRKQYDKA